MGVAERGINIPRNKDGVSPGESLCFQRLSLLSGVNLTEHGMARLA